MVLSELCTEALFLAFCDQEPPKTIQLQYEAGLLTHPPPRQALCIIELPSLLEVAQVLVNLGNPGSVALWQQVSLLQRLVLEKVWSGGLAC